MTASKREGLCPRGAYNVKGQRTDMMPLKNHTAVRSVVQKRSAEEQVQGARTEKSGDT